VSLAGKAARFWRCDLQVHSPFEPEFKPGVDRKQPRDVAGAAERFVDAALAAHLEVVAITDHNSAAFIPHVQTVAEERKLIVFPGVEVSAMDGYHVLCLFQPATPEDEIDNFLAKIGLERGKRRWDDGSVRVAEHPWDLAHVVDEVSARNGICIAPHVRSDKGLLDKAFANDIRVRNWKCEELLAVEDDRVELKAGSFEDDCLLNTRVTFERDHPFARVWGSDAKSYDGIGSSSTLIKMVEPTIEGLRQAFLDPGSRIRHPGSYERTLRDRFVAIEWDGGFFSGQRLEFSEQLNCLIGGKGTGKSTTLESIRFVLEHELPKGELRNQFDALAESALPPGTKVTLELERRDGTNFKLSRTSGSRTEVRDGAGDLLRLEPSDLMAVEILSQGEILETARDASALLRLIDGLAAPRLAEYAGAESALLSGLQTSRQRVERALRARDEQREQGAKQARLEDARKAFDKKGVAARTELRRMLDREEQLVADFRKRLTALREDIDSLIAFEDLPPLLADTDLPHESIWRDLKAAHWDKLMGRATDARRDLAGLLEGAEGALAATTAPESDWSVSLKAKREEVAKVYRELQEEFPELDLSLFERLDRELEELRLVALDPAGVDREVDAALKERDELLSSLGENRRLQFRAREQLAADLTSTLDGAVRVAVIFQGERRAFLETLTALKTKTRVEVLSTITDDGKKTPDAFGRALLAGADVVSKEFALSQAQATALVERIPLAEKLALQELRIPDKITVELNVSDDATLRYRSLPRLSVGQKATTILLVLLASGTSPLVIDQPESDLDNRFIVKDVVERLRLAKDSRQILLATHNANIPVLGDAELIAVLDADEVSGRSAGRFVDIGSIDGEAIKEAVNQILEGGREAFRLRQEKYGVPA
jgi:energy-coupling factor transporter ATP-binding protein EcfA2